MSGEVHHLTRRGTRKSLFVRPIATTTRPDELKMEFAKFGAVRDVHIPGNNILSNSPLMTHMYESVKPLRNIL